MAGALRSIETRFSVLFMTIVLGFVASLKWVPMNVEKSLTLLGSDPWSLPNNDCVFTVYTWRKVYYLMGLLNTPNTISWFPMSESLARLHSWFRHLLPLPHAKLLPPLQM